MNYWLLKTEPETFGIEHLINSPKQTTAWEGVRNYQARNMMRDKMRKGDLAFFYHSSCAIPGIVGIVEIVKEAYPDPSALNDKSPYYDPKSDADNIRWCMVDVKLVKKFSHIIPLSELKEHKDLADMQLLKKGNRLSILPITEKQWKIIVNMRK